MADEWRFSDTTAKKISRTVGAYAAEVTPGAAVKSVTGVARGEELFHRPELYRPWRAPATQRHAEQLVGKESEIEALTKRNSELRTETAMLQRELQRTQQKLRSEELGNSEKHEREVNKLNTQIKDLKRELDQLKASSDHQLRVVRSEHEIELKDLRGKVKLAQDAANDSGAQYQKQMAEVKNAAAREVQLIQQLAHARTAELQNELDASRDSLRRIQERTNAMLAESQGEMRRSEDRCLKQLKDQEVRYEEMRTQLYSEIHSLVAQRDAYAAELSASKEKLQGVVFEANETEARFKDWNVRLLSDLDQLHQYYSAVVADVAGGPRAGRPDVDHGAGDGASTLKGVMERVADRLQSLTTLRQQHAHASQGLLKKISTLETASLTAQELHNKAADEKEVQLTRLYSDTGEAKNRQARLEKAFAELKAQVETLQGKLLNAAHRLQFFSDDLNASLQGHKVPSNPPRGGAVTFVVTTVQGAAVLWESATTVMQSAMTICNDIIRAKLRQYGGYEFDADGASMMFAFHDPVSAFRFCLETQVWLVRARWPPELEEHHDSRTEVRAKAPGTADLTLFRGLRVGMAIHHGHADVEISEVPVGVGECRVQYYGKTVLQLLHLSGLATGGQVVSSAAAWAAIDNLADIGAVAMTDMGQHRISVTQRGPSDDREVQVSEMTGVLQVLPSELKERQFSRDDTYDSTVTQQGAIMGSHLSQFRRAVIAAEVAALRKHYGSLAKATDTIGREMASVAASVNAVSCKLRDAQVHGRVYSQADIVAHIAALDRIVARSEMIKRDVDRAITGQKDHAAQVKALEEQLMAHTKVTMTEDEFKKKLELVHERCNEKLFEGRLQNEHQLQQLRNALTRAEANVADLRKQLVGANHHATEERSLALVDVSNVALQGSTLDRKPSRLGTEVRKSADRKPSPTAAARRSHTPAGSAPSSALAKRK